MGQDYDLLEQGKGEPFRKLKTIDISIRRCSMDIEKQTCRKCGQTKLLSEYNRRSTTKTGLDSRCRLCVNTRRNNLNRGNQNHIEQSRKHRKLRQDFINSTKQKGCALCGYAKCMSALAYHHKDPSTKRDTISNMACRCASIEDIQEEINKCILLCQNCHHELHINDGTMGLNHRS